MMTVKPIIKVSDIMFDAEQSFWQQVVNHLPKSDGGDMFPEDNLDWGCSMENAIIAWWRCNAERHYDLQCTDGQVLRESKVDDEIF